MIASTAQKMMFSIKDFFSICDQIRSFLQIWSHLLKKSLMGNFIFSAVLVKLLYLDVRQFPIYCICKRQVFKTLVLYGFTRYVQRNVPMHV